VVCLFYDWLMYLGVDVGIDIGKFMMISEMGIVIYLYDF